VKDNMSMKEVKYENLLELNRKIGDEIKEAILRVYESGQYILGSEVETFEKKFAKYCDAEYCIGVGSGLDALVISFRSLNLPKDSEVITTANSYIASVNSICLADLVPIMVDPDENSYNFNLEKLKNSITPNTKAVLAVHMYGQSCDMVALKKICEENNLKLVEDCAQAHGAESNGQKVGTFGDVSAFSFYPSKNLGTVGDGGCVITNNAEIAEFIRMYRNYGSNIKYHNEMIGVNSRLDSIQAAILGVKLEYLDSINEHKQKLAQLYNEGLNEQLFIKPKVVEGNKHVYHIYNILHKARDDLRQNLLESGISTEIHYPIPIYKQNAYKGKFDDGSYPITENICNSTLSLPISYIHTEEDIKYVIDSCNKFIKKT
jgi:dTDP-4-amino-4,6-dideoxygalactose transaminase